MTDTIGRRVQSLLGKTVPATRLSRSLKTPVQLSFGQRLSRLSSSPRPDDDRLLTRQEIDRVLREQFGG